MGYIERRLEQRNIGYTKQQESCDDCKFNLPAEKLCHIVEGRVNNEEGISNFFPLEDTECYQGDILWYYVNQRSEKLDYEKGRVIREATEGFQCKYCKYYLNSSAYLLIKGILEPEMSCPFIVKIGNGIKL